MSWIDPGEFGRGAAAREETRADHERAALDRLLAAGWTSDTVQEARRLQEAMAVAVARVSARPGSARCSETALELVGEARGMAVADWWAQTHGLDDLTRTLLRECAAAAAALAIVDGFYLGRECAAEEQAVPPPVARRAFAGPVASEDARVNGARVPARVR